MRPWVCHPHWSPAKACSTLCSRHMGPTRQANMRHTWEPGDTCVHTGRWVCRHCSTAASTQETHGQQGAARVGPGCCQQGGRLPAVRRAPWRLPCVAAVQRLIIGASSAWRWVACCHAARGVGQGCKGLKQPGHSGGSRLLVRACTAAQLCMDRVGNSARSPTAYVHQQVPGEDLYTTGHNNNC